ncbi:MAG: PH domain-containing protein [Nanoarchaeota archaeon]|nr:PH domain-containing protein [Nanoarchaeota archaeon]
MPIEEPVHKRTQSRISFVKNYLLSAFLAIFLACLFLIKFPLTQTGLAASAALIFIFVIHPEIERIRSTYVITTSQVIVEEGIISRKRRSVFFDNVADVSVHQNFIQRLLRYGLVTIGSNSGREYMELKLKGVQRPKELAYSIERLIKEYAGGKRGNKDGKKENAEAGEKKENGCSAKIEL